MMGSMMRRAMIGDGSTLNVDFTSMTNGGQLANAGFTFTNATTTARTYINASGIVATATTNEPRFDHDPTTLAPRGLLIEGTATNLFNWSETFDTTGGATNWNWSVNVTRGTVTTTNPTGASATVIKIEETTTNGLHAPLTVPTVLASTTYTFSVWAKAVERTFVQLWENGGSGANGMVNLSTGAVVSESTAGITTVTALGTTGWYRISMRLTTIVGQTTANCQLRLSTNGTTTSYAGTTGSGIYIWGAQLEAGSGASSYIPTGASQVQRLADECSMTGTNFSSWFNATEGTFLAHARRIRTTDLGRIASANDNTTNESIDLGADTTGEFIVTDGGSALATISPGTVTANTAFRIAGAYKLNDVQAALGGTLGVADTSVTLPTVNRLMLGRQAGGSPVYLNGTVAVLKYWPTRLSNGELQTLTT